MADPTWTAWEFESGGMPTRGKQAGLYVKIELAWQDVTSWPLTECGFSSPISAPWIFTLPKIRRESEPDAGIMGISAVSLEAQNRYIGTDGTDVSSGDIVAGRMYRNVGYTTVTYDSVDYSEGQYFRGTSETDYTTSGSGTVERLYTLYDVLTDPDYDEYDIHVRISSKTTSGGSYVVRFWGVYDYASLSANILDPTNPETWTIQFSARDGITQLERRTIADFRADEFTDADYGYIGTDKYVTRYGTSSWEYASGSYIPPGRYLIHGMFFDDGATGDWTHNFWSGHTIGSSHIPLRYFKPADIFKAIAIYLGFAGAVNDPSDSGTTAWSGYHSWVFYLNNGNSTSTGATNMIGVNIASLAVPYAFVFDGSHTSYRGGLFDPENQHPASFYSLGSPLEMLKKICASFGMVARTRINTSGERYLEIISSDALSSSETLSDYSLLAEGMELTPNQVALAGCDVVSPALSNIGRSSIQSGDSIKVDCIFTTLNAIAIDDRFRYTVAHGAFGLGFDDGSGARQCGINVIPTEAHAFWSSLWVLYGTNSTTTRTNDTYQYAYSVCQILPSDAAAAAQGADPGNIPAYGAWNTSLGTPSVTYPNVSTPYSEWSQVPAMALAHFMFNDVALSVDAVGLYRPRGMGVDFVILSLPATPQYPPLKYTIVLNGVSREFFCTSVEEDILENTVSYSGYTREI